MKIGRFILCLAIVLILGSRGKAETDYWEEIKLRTAAEAPTVEEAKELKEYVEALSSKELLTAARQCSAEMEKTIAPEDWDVAVGSLGFFFQRYPQKTNNLEDISPLLVDMKDRSQSVFWRRAIMDLLRSAWSDKLSAEQCYETAKLMREIYEDSSENSLMKPKAIRSAANLSLTAYSRNLWNDPNARAFTQEQRMRTKELVNAVRAGAVKLAPKTIEANKKVMAEIERAISTQLTLFGEKETDNEVKTSIIVSWGRYHKYKLDTPAVPEALATALDDYRNYDEKLWYLLVRGNAKDFGNQTSRLELQTMISDAKDKREKERLARLKKELYGKD